MSQKEFWRTRSVKYDELKWVKDNDYLSMIFNHVQPKLNDSVLDIGVGTGSVAHMLLPYVKEVAGLDISTDMVSEISDKIKFIEGSVYDIKQLCKNKKYDIITARMIFHHCPKKLDRIIKTCYNLLNKGGRLVIAESVPPSNINVVSQWWKEVRAMKESRTTYSYEQFATFLLEAKFEDILSDIYVSDRDISSTVNWLESSGLDLMSKYNIIKSHIEAPDLVKSAHNMIVTDTDILCEHHHLVISGTKNS